MHKILSMTFGAILAYSAANAGMYDKRSSKQSDVKDFLGRTYVGIKGGYVSPVSFSVKPNENIKHDNATGMYGLMAGYRINKWWRSDLELSHRHESTAKNSSVSGGSPDDHVTTVSSSVAMWNNYLMLPQMYAQPFINIGLGVSQNKMGNYKINNVTFWPGATRTAFAYQAGAGLTFSYQNLDVDGMLQYVNRGEARTKAGTSGSAPRKVTMQDVVLSMSLRYNL